MAESREGFIGIDLGGTNLRGGLVDPQGSIVRRAAVLTGASLGKEEVISRVALLVEDLSGGESFPVGIASPGPVERRTGVLHNPPNLPGWDGVDLRRELEGRLQTKIYVQNDANMVAYGEFCYGAGKGAESLLCLTLGTGIGSGLILDGRLYTGEHGFAAELGHTVIEPHGPVCACGTQGCLECLAAAGAIVDEAQRLIKTGAETLLVTNRGEMTAEAVGMAAARGDPLAMEVLKKTGTYLGIAISNVLALLDITLIVVGGGIAKSGDLILEPIRNTVARTLIAHDLRKPRIVPSELGDDAGILGISAYSRSNI